MRAWRIFLYASVVILLTGTMVSLMTDKGDFNIWLSQNRTIALDYFFYYITLIGEPHGFIIAGLILWWKSWKKMIWVPILGLTVTIVTYLLKSWFEHERPRLYFERLGWDGPLQVLDYHLLTGHSSFPSGHSMAAWAICTFFAAMMRHTVISVICVGLAVSVCISRVYLTAHFLRDVVAGGAVGLLLGILIIWACRRVTPSAHSLQA